jgi:tetratricopeptide (TPR) repeat protein
MDDPHQGYQSLLPESSSSAAAASSLTPLQQECMKLLHSKQYKSCTILAGLELSKAEQESRDTRIAYAILGDCAQMTEQYNKAISYYRKVQLLPGSNSKPYGTNNNHRYRIKEAQCLQALGSVVEAASVLETIPEAERTLQIHMTLGQLYVASKRPMAATQCFLASLKQNPLTFEAIEWLTVTGKVDKHDILDAINTGFKSMDKKSKTISQENNSGDVNGVQGSIDNDNNIVPVKEFVNTLFAKGRHQTALALKNFTALEQQYPNDVYLLLNIANLQVSLVGIVVLNDSINDTRLFN